MLALKRHEQPPPGYFNHFSGQVVARIKAGERVDESVLDRLFWEAPWIQRLWAALEAKPILAGAFGATVCGLLIFGVIYSERLERQAGRYSWWRLKRRRPTRSRLRMSRPQKNCSWLSQPPLAFSDKTGMVQPVAIAKAHGTLFDLAPKPQAEAASLGLTLVPERN